MPSAYPSFFFSKMKNILFSKFTVLLVSIDYHKSDRSKICFNGCERRFGLKNFKQYRVIEMLNLLSYSVLPIIFWISIIFGFDTPCVAILTIVAAILHELGHYIAIFYLSGSGQLRGHSSGFRIKQQESLSYGKQISVLLAGPLLNIVIFLLCLPLGNRLYGYIKLFGYINAATGISNLLPLEGYDGYGALHELFRYFAKDSLISILEIFSFVLSIFMMFISLYLIDRFSEGYWIFGLFFAAVLSKLANFDKYDIFGQ